MKIMGIHARMLYHRDNLRYYSNINVFAKYIYLENTNSGTEWEVLLLIF